MINEELDEREKALEQKKADREAAIAKRQDEQQRRRDSLKAAAEARRQKIIDDRAKAKAEKEKLFSERYYLNLAQEISLDRQEIQSMWFRHRDDAAIEGGFDPKFGDVTWRTLICQDRMNSDNIVLGSAHIPAFGRLPLHRHDPAEFYYFLSGHGHVTIDGKATPVNSGVAVFIPGGAEHGINAGEESLDFIYGFAQHRFGDVVYNFSDQQGADQ